MTRRTDLERKNFNRNIEKERELAIPDDLLQQDNDDNVMGVYYLDLSNKPENTRYDWKRTSCFGQEDKEHQVFLKRRYWTAVPGGRHPEAGGVGEEPLIIRGLMLMECPEHIAKFYDGKVVAKNAQAMDTQEQMQRLGESKNRDMPRVVQKFSRSFAPDQAIPE